MNTTINERIATEINKIIDGLNACRAMSGKSWQQLADEASKDISTLRKQLDRDSNPKASTLVELAMLFGAQICVETEASQSENVVAYRERLTELQTERDQLKVERDHLSDLVQQQSEMIDAQTKRIERYDAQIADMMRQMETRLQFMGKIYENLDAETKENRALRAENKGLLDKLLKLKGVDL